ncbi:hypothetical protein [Deinococcus sp.]|uniref:hypothetical protein n=1 Tax=Deinococcus sp. TaxID=47478 RepID=UPI003B5BA5DA
MATVHRSRRFQHLLTGLALCGLATASVGAGISTGPFVNVNGKYVLYSYPAAPYARQGVVYAPLVSFAELLGIRVTQNANPAAVTLNLNGKSFAFRVVGSRLVGVAGGHSQVPVERLPGGTLVAALPPLLDALKVSYQLDATGLRVTDQRFLNPQRPPGQQSTYANGLPNIYKSWDYFFLDQAFPESRNFVPTNFALSQATGSVTVEARFNLREPRRPSEGLSVMVYHSNAAISVKGDGLKPPPEPPPLPPSSRCQYMAQAVRCTLKTDIQKLKGAHVQYVLVHAFNTP